MTNDTFQAAIKAAATTLAAHECKQAKRFTVTFDVTVSGAGSAELEAVDAAIAQEMVERLVRDHIFIDLDRVKRSECRGLLELGVDDVDQIDVSISDAVENENKEEDDWSITDT
jgi:hypothetical protein